MTPSDAVRLLLEANESGLLPSDADGHCWYCSCHLLHDGSGHDAACPWPTLPRVAAALEAAERLITPYDAEPAEYSRAEDAHYHAFCERSSSQGHDLTCPWEALVAALKGES